MESNGLVRVTMRRTIENRTVVLDLKMGQTYELPPGFAEQLCINGAAARADESPELEAAALRTARRRG